VMENKGGKGLRTKIKISTIKMAKLYFLRNVREKSGGGVY